MASAAPAPTSPAADPAAHEAVARTLFQSTTQSSIENIHVRPDGHLLFTTLNSGSLYSLDPTAPSPQPKVVADLSPATGLAGIALLDPAANLWAVSGGEHISFGWVNGSVAVYVVQLPPHSDTTGAKVLHRIPVNATLNGMDALPEDPRTVLAVDSIGATVIRVNTKTQVVDVAISDPALAGTAAFRIGVNGARVHGKYLYFTNSGQGTFGRFPIDAHGSKTGDVQILATLPQLPASRYNAFDDFTFDRDGNAYVALHSSSYVKIKPDGKLSQFVNSTEDASGQKSGIYEPTSAALSLDGKRLYLCAAGIIDGTSLHGGQVLAVQI